jgi:hypothetical protein
MTTRTVSLEPEKARFAGALVGDERPRRPVAKREPVSRGGFVGALRAVANVIADDCTSFADAAVRQTQRVVLETVHKASNRSIWLPSFLALGSADVAIASRLSRTTVGLEAVGAAGGAGLVAVSTMNLWRARTSEERLDAVADFAWGVQGFTYITGAARVASVTAGMGFVGAAARMSVGALRIWTGIRERDTQAVKLGTLDLGAGTLWAALDVAGLGHPLVLGSYVVMMVGREAYANRDALRKAVAGFPQRLAQLTSP